MFCLTDVTVLRQDRPAVWGFRGSGGSDRRAVQEIVGPLRAAYINRMKQLFPERATFMQPSPQGPIAGIAFY